MCLILLQEGVEQHLNQIKSLIVKKHTERCLNAITDSKLTDTGKLFYCRDGFISLICILEA